MQFKDTTATHISNYMHPVASDPEKICGILFLDINMTAEVAKDKDHVVSYVLEPYENNPSSFLG